MTDSSPWFLLTLAVLATWRVAHLVAHEDGPFDLVVRLRRRAGNGMLGRLMDCPYCLSLWIAAPAALLLIPLNTVTGHVPEWTATWLAISGGASLLEKLVQSLPVRRATTDPLPFLGAHDDELLRTEPSLDEPTGLPRQARAGDPSG